MLDEDYVGDLRDRLLYTPIRALMLQQLLFFIEVRLAKVVHAVMSLMVDSPQLLTIRNRFLPSPFQYEEK